MRIKWVCVRTMLCLVPGYLVRPWSWPLGASGVPCGKKDGGHFQPWPRWAPLSTSHHPEAWLSAFPPATPPALHAPMALRCRCWKLDWISLDLIATPENYISKINAANHTAKGKFTNRFSFPGKHHLCLSSFVPILSNNSKIQSQYLFGASDLPASYKGRTRPLQVLGPGACSPVLGQREPIAVGARSTISWTLALLELHTTMSVQGLNADPECGQRRWSSRPSNLHQLPWPRVGPPLSDTRIPHRSSPLSPLQERAVKRP